jgi:hypothetical protein
MELLFSPLGFFVLLVLYFWATTRYNQAKTPRNLNLMLASATLLILRLAAASIWRGFFYTNIASEQLTEPVVRGLNFMVLFTALLAFALGGLGGTAALRYLRRDISRRKQSVVAVTRTTIAFRVALLASIQVLALWLVADALLTMLWLMGVIASN